MAPLKINLLRGPTPSIKNSFQMFVKGVYTVSIANRAQIWKKVITIGWSNRRKGTTLCPWSVCRGEGNQTWGRAKELPHVGWDAS